MRSSFVGAILLLLLVPGFAADRKASVASDTAAGSKSLHVPLLGFVAPSGAPLRPVIGTRGAAVFGDPLALPSTVTGVTLSPAGSFAVIERQDGSPLSLVPLTVDGPGSIQPITGAFSGFDLIAFSPSGTVVLFYSASARRIQIAGGGPTAPLLSREIDVSSIAAPVVSVAVSDDASILLAGTSDGKTGEVYRILTDNSIAGIYSGAVPAALRFLPGTDSVLVADSGLNQVLSISAVSGTPVPKRLAAADDGADGPNLIEMLPGNRTAVVANLCSNSLLIIDLQQATTSAVAISSPATALRSLGNQNGVMVSTSSPPAYWLLTGDSTAPTLTLIASAGANQ